MFEVLQDITELSQWSTQQPVIPRLGFLLFPSAVSSQLTDFIAECCAYANGGVRCCVVYANMELTAVLEQLVDMSVTILPLSLLQQHSALQGNCALDMLFIQESYFAPELTLPKNLVRVGLPHGTDIPIKKTLTTYGGILEFDYVLAISSYPAMDDQAFYHEYPLPLRSHQRPYCCVIPFGMPKFDRFLRQCRLAGKPDSIIFHLSNLRIERPDVVALSAHLLPLILQAFPHYRVIFRPFPADLAHPDVRALIDIGQGFDNFIVSDSPSYINDYARGSVMLCFRDYSEHLFAQATGRPVLLVDEESDQLLTKIELALSDKSLNTNKPRVFNPGNSVGYLLSQLDFMLTAKTHPEWQYFQLSMKDSEADIAVLIQRHLSGSSPFHKLALAALTKFPDQFRYVLAVVVSLSRAPLLANQQLAQLYWQKAVDVLTSWLAIRQIDKPQLTLLACYLAQANQACQRYLCYPKQCSEAYRAFSLRLARALKTVKPLTVMSRNFRHAQSSTTLLSGGDVQLYGAGELGQRYALNSRFREIFNIVNWVDQSERMQGQRLADVTISAPSTLSQFNAPVLVCSVAYAEEIYCYLTTQLGLQHDIYFVE
ncbi:hypothetical protein GCM10010919_19090 [Alishewanella longhuensis]|uniref:Uncharacterized protein n=1 Tax=Alishewanella longhuensis TaxID=1091037 RepID=A0ABQ3L0A5_9ALTE|nr:hypothetical protein [Alishewanella longhuensis]GHG69270.1 hypothetical protein GCM10010919_19090 [Alishewanella longhuensis]